MGSPPPKKKKQTSKKPHDPLGSFGHQTGPFWDASEPTWIAHVACSWLPSVRPSTGREKRRLSSLHSCATSSGRMPESRTEAKQILKEQRECFQEAEGNEIYILYLIQGRLKHRKAWMARRVRVLAGIPELGKTMQDLCAKHASFGWQKKLPILQPPRDKSCMPPIFKSRDLRPAPWRFTRRCCGAGFCLFANVLIGSARGKKHLRFSRAEDERQGWDAVAACGLQIPCRSPGDVLRRWTRKLGFFVPVGVPFLYQARKGPQQKKESPVGSKDQDTKGDDVWRPWCYDAIRIASLSTFGASRSAGDAGRGHSRAQSRIPENPHDKALRHVGQEAIWLLQRPPCKKFV